MSEHEPLTPDPLARIGARLIEAAEQRRVHRRHARQRAAGVALLLVLVAGAAVALARPFGGGGNVPATGIELRWDPRFQIWENDGAGFCTTLPDLRGLPGVTACMSPGVIGSALTAPGLLWAEARADGDRIAVTGVVSGPTRQIVIDGQAAPVTGPTATVESPLLAGGSGTVRAFRATLPRGGRNRVDIGTDRSGMGLILRVGELMTPQIFQRRVDFATSRGVDAAALVPRVAARLHALLFDGSSALGVGSQLILGLGFGSQPADVRAALAPGRLTLVDWDADRIAGAMPTRAAALLRARAAGDATVVRVGAGRGVAPGWYALHERPPLPDGAVTDVSRSGGSLIVALDAGAAAQLRTLTRTLALRGTTTFRRRLAVVADDEVVQLQPIPPGTSRAGNVANALGLQGLSRLRARRLAAQLTTGPLPPLRRVR